MPRISVVIPLYNKALHIARAVESVLKQSFGDFEIVIVDDGSTDGGAGIVRGMTDARIRLIQKANGGASAARNRGIAEARAELIAFLDADDAWEPRFLETIARLRTAFPHAGAYATAYRMRDRGGKEEVKDYHAIPEAPWEGIVPDYFASVVRSSLIWTSAVAVPKDVFSAVGGFPESEATGEDLEMWFRIAVKYPVAFSRYVGSTWHRDSTNRICETVATPADPLILRTVRRTLQSGGLGPQLSQKLRDYHDTLASFFANACLHEGRRESARQLLGSRLEPRICALSLLTLLPGGVVGLLLALNRYRKGLSVGGAH